MHTGCNRKEKFLLEYTLGDMDRLDHNPSQVFHGEDTVYVNMYDVALL